MIPSDRWPDAEITDDGHAFCRLRGGLESADKYAVSDFTARFSGAQRGPEAACDGTNALPSQRKAKQKGISDAPLNQ
jgi:hypothetical protein